MSERKKYICTCLFVCRRGKYVKLMLTIDICAGIKDRETNNHQMGAVFSLLNDMGITGSVHVGFHEYNQNNVNEAFLYNHVLF